MRWMLETAAFWFFFKYTSGFLPYILLVTQAPILVWLDGSIIDISTILVTMYYYNNSSE